ncbi:enoyl-CoA hydratase/isomerase family protein [Mycobacterium branderi]|uniref:Enoyl-CoA hydratase n=1 Tax=Mycobacterium branderi TaxID=43348 RepID=A0A7I7WDI8_9MYCO|nr:enoyl-CoA hydratase/isomerase family protein [Mycobacterium branderi]MCV7231752.1 enoyl-CoA hydratase/isomerase family protein [Mycobacterium branderi]ORA40281.1 hypothetical protein BST20_06945 [Mycobacterium branderi]BBZ15596.1 enoyl-CoA hydratase [Mycobacterium branderi]
MSDIVAERLGAVLLVHFNRPDRGNAIGGTLLRDLAEVFDEARRDDSVHVVVTTGEGKNYCVGADIADLEKAVDVPARELLASNKIGGDKGVAPLSFHEMQVDDLGNAGRVVSRLWALDKPTIAAVNGAAVGGGFAIALLHDIRIAAENTRIGTAFTSLGLAPELGASYLLPRIVGSSVAADLLLRSEILPADRALDVGLVSEVVPVGQLTARALDLAEQIARKPPLATRWTKRLLRTSATGDFTDQLRHEHLAQVNLFDQKATREAIRETVNRLGKGG